MISVRCVHCSVFSMLLKMENSAISNVSMQVRGHKKFSSHDQIFNYNPESKEDFHLAHIELPIISPKSLTNPRAAIVFRPA